MLWHVVGMPSRTAGWNSTVPSPSHFSFTVQWGLSYGVSTPCDTSAVPPCSVSGRRGPRDRDLAVDLREREFLASRCQFLFPECPARAFQTGLSTAAEGITPARKRSRRLNVREIQLNAPRVITGIGPVGLHHVGPNLGLPIEATEADVRGT